MPNIRRRLLGAFALVCLASVAQAVDFGRTRGSFDISPSGAATYTIPIWTPPGPNGIQPSLSLSYSSQSGNGLAGVGWNLDAVTAIERCNKTVHQDGNAAPVALTLDDRFCLGGKRLRLYSGTYGQNLSVYYTEIADYSRVTAYGTTGNGPTYFIVEAKSGLKYQYGNTSDSRVVLGGTVVRWMLNKVMDRNDPVQPNNYVISYINANGFAIPNVISWTPTYLGSSSYRYQAKFNYLTTRSDKDSYKGRVAGFDVTNRNRIENIQIKSNGAVVRKYRFVYDTAPVTFRSRLTSAKECADDAESNCLLPISFTYQAGVSGLTAGSGPVPTGSSNGIVKGRYDFNGDGKDDILYTGSGGICYAAFGANAGFSGPYTAACGVVDRFLPIGRDAIGSIVGGALWVYRWDDSTSAFVGYNTGVSASSVFPVDYDGDGLADLVTRSADNKSLYVRRNTSTGSTNPTFHPSTWLAATLPSSAFGGTPTFQNFWTYFGQGLKYTDVNGDGRQDFHALIRVQFGMGVSMYSAVILGSGGGFTIPSSANWSPYSNVAFPSINFNGDQCNDRLGGSTVYISTCNGVAATTITAPAAPLNVMDWDGDGKTDILVNSGGNFAVYLSTGTGFSGPFSTSIPSTGDFFSVDQDGDGQEDLIKLNGTGAISYWTHTDSGAIPTSFAPNIPDLLASATDGFGVGFQPGYISTSWGNYWMGTTTSYPLQESGPKIVVATVLATNGIGGLYAKNYFYVGARDNADREDFAGFQRVDETDGRNGITTRTHFEQAFPLTGMVKQREVLQPIGSTVISNQVISNASSVLDSSANNQRYFNYASGMTATQYEVGGMYNGSLVRTVATANLYDNASGALYDRTVTITEPVSGANGVTAGGQWTERTYVPTGYLLNNTANWCLGRPQRIQQTNSSNLAYGASITRTEDVVWDAGFCRPTQTIVEAGSPTEAVTDIGYDAFGNVSSSTITGAGMTPRTTAASYLESGFSTGQFPLKITNALNQVSELAWDYDLGVPISAKDPNGIPIGWQYDPYGRRTREDRPDGTYTTWDYLSCSGCDSRVRLYIQESSRAADGALFGREQVYIDEFDRWIYDYQLRSDGTTYNIVARTFDGLGRLSTESFPYLSSGSSAGSTTMVYDLVNRPIGIVRPISDTNPATQSATVWYLGLTTRIFDENLKSSYRVRNAAGLLARSQDHDGNYQGFDYDAFGNLKRVQDSAGNTLQSSNYNVRGMLTDRIDMDMGTWTYDVNALGEVVHIRDAKTSAPNWTQSLSYDLLGRLTSRSESEGTSTWTWGILSDNTAANKYVGRLKSVSGPGYSETYTYDAIGRLSNTSISADTSYQIDYSYNSIGVLDTLTYPLSTSSYRLKLRYEYQSGYLYRIKECSTSACTSFGTTFWTANSFNARNQITQEALGNGLVTNRVFDNVTGWLKTIQTGPSGGSSVQNLAYTWDLVGNLSTRKDLNQSNLTESFFYDNLYRLDYSQLNGVTNLDLGYDALGNIKSKSDVGQYTYHPTRKHQVASTDNGWTFSYDSNGNMTGGGGRSIDWTSYNAPACIRTGSSCSGTSTDYSAFSYTPDRQYWKQVSNYVSGGSATTIYLGGLLEKVTTSAGTDFRHHIRAGGATITVSRKTSGTNTVYYTASDHLGSSSAITASNGGILVNSSFDAFGRRRGANWTGNPSPGDWTAIAGTTRRGYTEHSMLDNLTLIHMNGRVQDPVLGRFLSADPFVADPLSTQNWNRYSYVDNNPLSALDPSGFRKIVIRVGGCVQRGEGGSFALNFTFGASDDSGWSFDFGFGNSGGASRGPDLICGYRDVVIEIPDEATPPDMNAPKPDLEIPKDTVGGWSGEMSWAKLGKGFGDVGLAIADAFNRMYTNPTINAGKSFTNLTTFGGKDWDHVHYNGTVHDVEVLTVYAATIYSGAKTAQGAGTLLNNVSKAMAARAGTAGASGELVTASGNRYFGNSVGSAATGGTARAPMQPQVQRALDAVSNPSRTHGACCEIDAMNKALNAGDTLQGARMGPVRLNESGRAIPACSTCREVKKMLGVE